ncbi:MAG TPA: hypothetical protein VF607_08860, partial [Verrucomicrobiae bacterium]
MSVVSIAAVVGIAATGASVGMSAAGVGQPTQPNLSSSSQLLANTNAALLPLQRGFEAAQQLGQDYTFSLPQGVTAKNFGVQLAPAGWYDASGNLVSTNQELFNGGTASTSAGQSLADSTGPTNGRGRSGDGRPGQTGAAIATNRAQETSGLTWRPATGNYNGTTITQNADGTYTAHFKGYGQTDVNKANAQKSAANQLALAQKYDPQFIAEALKQQREADPEAAQARAVETQLIQDQINRPPNNPVADQLQQQVGDTLAASGQGRLTDLDQARLNAAVSEALGVRGGGSGPADFAAPLTNGFAGEERQSAANQAALGFLSSGSAPEDIAYRREQQNLSNLAAQ